MYDAFSGWVRLMASGYSMVETGVRVVETMDASREVITKRSRVIGTALRSPLDSDPTELGRMIPEKVEAFSEAGAATVAVWRSMQDAWLNQIQHLGRLAMQGRAPTLKEVVDLNNRNVSLVVGSIEAGARLGSESLAPVHRKAMANARRLRKKTASAF